MLCLGDRLFLRFSGASQDGSRSQDESEFESLSGPLLSRGSNSGCSPGATLALRWTRVLQPQRSHRSPPSEGPWGPDLPFVPLLGGRFPSTLTTCSSQASALVSAPSPASHHIPCLQPDLLSPSGAHPPLPLTNALGLFWAEVCPLKVHMSKSRTSEHDHLEIQPYGGC